MIHYNREALEKLTDEQLRSMYNDKTTPTLKQVCSLIGRKLQNDEKLIKQPIKKTSKK